MRVEIMTEISQKVSKPLKRSFLSLSIVSIHIGLATNIRIFLEILDAEKILRKSRDF